MRLWRLSSMRPWLVRWEMQSTDVRVRSEEAKDPSERPSRGRGVPSRRRFRRVQMTLSVADAQDEGRVRELVQTVEAATRKRAQEDISGGGESTSSATATDGAADPAAHPTKRATRLTRPANAARGGSTGDAMSGHFRMYDLVGDEDEATPRREAISSGQETRWCGTPAGRGTCPAL